MDALKNILNFNKKKTENYLEVIKNGRINIMGKPISSRLYPLFEESNSGNSIYNKEALKSIQYNSEVSRKFFSKNNIDTLHKIMRYQVWLGSNKKYIIGRQSDEELKIIMRSIYLQYGKHRKKGVVEQIKDLNEVVCQYTIPNILSNIEQYLGYKRAVSQLPKPIPLPENLSIKGTK